ncbi:MAG: right-handed parallel beta-helix repeat-containing protein [Verrucomicrobia bacterium]|nr:right-handed parallel beta-helix repeat-containing protein [Verrucomicrobiota bacterium]
MKRAKRFVAGAWFCALCAAVFSTSAATFTVVNANDSGAGSLRQAILDANKAADQETIEFNIVSVRPGPRPVVKIPTIKLLSPLPMIVQPVKIDGTTQVEGKVELDGSGAGAAASGLRVTAGDSQILGLVINGFAGHGVEFIGPRGNNTLGECFVGTDADGKLARPNSGDGILITNSPANDVGRAARLVPRPGFPSLSGLTNLISGNARNGVEIFGPGSSNNIVANNWIGLDAAGTTALGNGSDGVQIQSGALGNTIGGAASNAGNVISANGDYGVRMLSRGVTNVITFTSTDVPKILALPPREPLPTNGFVTQTTFSILNVSTDDPVIDVDVELNLNYQPVGGLSLSITGPTGTKVGLSDQSSFDDLFFGVNLGYGANFTGTIFDDDTSALFPYYLAPYTGRFKPSGFYPPDYLSDFDLQVPQGEWRFDIGLLRNFISIPSGGTGLYDMIESQPATLVSWSVLLTTVHGNEVAGNFIGTDAAGRLALGNGLAGVVISDSSGNRVGASTAASRNVISGNRGNGGILIIGSRSSANLVRGNFIGTDAGGTQPLGNASDGVRLAGGENNAIGGLASADGNVIAASGSAGLCLTAGAKQNRVQSNFIGTDATATRNLGNGTNGVHITGGASENLIGGIVYASSPVGPGYSYVVSGANTIAFSGGDAVLISPNAIRAETERNRIIANNFMGNAGRAINYVGKFFPKPLDPPVVDSVKRGNQRLFISDITTTPPAAPTTFEIDFYMSDTSDTAFSGRQQIFLGGFPAGIDGEGNITETDLGNSFFTFSGIATPSLINFIAATLTDQDGNTSEFSTPVPISPGSLVYVNSRIHDGTEFGISFGYAQVGMPITMDLRVFNLGPDPDPNFVVTNQIPAGLELVSVTSTQGALANNNGSVICDLGTVNVREGTASAGAHPTNIAALVTLTFLPTATGKFTNIFSFNSVSHPRPLTQKTIFLVRDPVPWRQQLDADGFKIFIPTNAAPFQLRYTDSLSPPITWRLPIVLKPTGDQFVYTNRTDTSNRFFRLIPTRSPI